MLLITRMIADRIGLHSVLLPLFHSYSFLRVLDFAKMTETYFAGINFHDFTEKMDLKCTKVRKNVTKF